MLVNFSQLDLDDLYKEYSSDSYYEKVIAFVKLISAGQDFKSQTSGSTGEPKLIEITYLKALESARISNNYFQISPNTKFAMCLDIRYIGAKMLLFRALIAKASVKVVYPDLNFYHHLDSESIDFISLTPLHVADILEKCPHFFHKVHTCLIGASGVSIQLEQAILEQKYDTVFYESFAMTETISHFAIRNISQRQSYFQLLEGFSISRDSNNCLEIGHPKILPEKMKTNDIIEIVEANKQFIFKGRYDHIINTNGIKLSPEALEKEWGLFLNFKFIIASEPDPILNQKIILICNTNNLCANEIRDLLLANNVPSKFLPKAFYYTQIWAETDTLKPIRTKIMETRKILS